MQQLQIHLNTKNSEIRIHNIKFDDSGKKAQLENECKDLFYNNRKIKDLSVKINLKEGTQLIQQKGRPLLLNLQEQVAKELKRLIKNGYQQRATKVTEDCSVSPAVIKVKRDKSIKIALDSRKLNEITIKRNTQLPIMEELTSKISEKISEGEDSEILATKFDFFYEYGQIKLDKRTRNLSILTVTG